MTLKQLDIRKQNNDPWDGPTDYPSLLPGESFQVIRKGDGAESPWKQRQLEFSESTAREKEAEREFRRNAESTSSTDQCICEETTPSTGKETPKRIRTISSISGFSQHSE